MKCEICKIPLPKNYKALSGWMVCENCGDLVVVAVACEGYTYSDAINELVKDKIEDSDNA